MKKLLFIAAVWMLPVGCNTPATEEVMSTISQTTVQTVKDNLIKAYSVTDATLMERGVEQAAQLWRAEDGSEADFAEFCTQMYKGTPQDKQVLFEKLSAVFEQLFGTANQLSVKLKMPVTLTGDDLTEIDYIMGNYSPSAHFSDDLFANKVAFLCVLNFPNYTLAQKEAEGAGWSRLQWAYARMGDIFTDRLPASLAQEMAQVSGDAENYISSYNIMMGHLLNEQGERLFPEDMVLLSHWNLRDEIKSNYADVPRALEKQKMIYKVMEHIACQTIPAVVVNNDQVDWAPYANQVFRDGKQVEAPAEGNVRYQHLLNEFQVGLKADAYYPQMPTAIARNFEGDMEVSAQEIEDLFVRLISSNQVKKVAEVIRQRLGRDLEPFDIWYDGFKGRTAVSEDLLTAKTRAMYPNPAAFQKDMPRMLKAMGFTAADADFLASKMVVEGARGSGHAWGAQGRWEPARLRTRIGTEGMDYKGYNIAVHEFGHNVEQTLSLYNMDYYMLNGVPNTAFTEALAFVFQKRDLQLLGYPQTIDDGTTLDIFWGAYEIMGVSLVDMYSWRWMYEHPQASAQELKEAVLANARQVWNTYYADVLGVKDSPILAIYSHMIDAPMYLPNYPFGHLIEFQLENYVAGAMKAQGKDFAQEIKRMFTQGTLVPQLWMQGAVGSKVSVEPLLEAVDNCLNRL